MQPEDLQPMDLDLTISESEDLDLEEEDLDLDLPLWDLTTSLSSVFNHQSRYSSSPMKLGI